MKGKQYFLMPKRVIFRNLLLLNGTAVDAALATLFCNGVVHSNSMGIGGGFLMTIYIRFVHANTINIISFIKIIVIIINRFYKHTEALKSLSFKLI